MNVGLKAILPIRNFGEFANLSVKWVAGCAGVVILNGKVYVIA